QSGRCLLRPDAGNDDLRPVAWDDGPPWQFRLAVVPGDSGKQYVLSGRLRRGTDQMPVTAPVVLVRGGLVFWEDTAARVDDGGAFGWADLFRKRGALLVPMGQKADLLKELLKL